MLFSINETGISGSLTKLATGESYLAAGQNISIVTGSNGQVTISSTSETSSSTAWFGTGDFGIAVLDGTNTFTWASKSGNDYSLTQDIFLSTLDVKSAITLKTQNYRIFVNGETIVSGTIDNSGPNRFATGAGTLPQAASSTGGPGENADLGGAGGSGTTTAGGNVTGKGPRAFPQVLDMFNAPTNTPYKAGAAGGYGGGAEYGGAGGGHIILVSKNVRILSGGLIRSNGGDGNYGGGGGGGVIVLVTQSPLQNSGSIQVNGGISNFASAGSVGRIMQFQI